MGPKISTILILRIFWCQVFPRPIPSIIFSDLKKMKQSWDWNVILWLQRIRAHKDCPKTNKVFGIPQIPLQKFKYILIDLFWYSQKHKHGRIRSFSIQSKKRKVSASAEHLINLVNMWSIMSNCTETTFKDVSMPRVPGSVQFGKDWVELWRQILLSGKESSVNWHRDPVHQRGPGAQEEENTLDDIINLRKPWKQRWF